MLIFNKDFVKYFSLLGYLGFIMIFNIGIFVFLYKIIERYFGSNTGLFILFVIIGVVGGFYNSYNIIMKK